MYWADLTATRALLYLQARRTALLVLVEMPVKSFAVSLVRYWSEGN